jgi:GNAT superfamily N-acetyltransferase
VSTPTRSSSVVLRPEQPADRTFLQPLFWSTRRHEFALLGWDSATADQFATFQYDAQARHYSTAFPALERYVVERDDLPVGRCYLARSDAGVHLVDLLVSEQQRGAGIGTYLLEQLVEQARERSEVVTLTVEHANKRARALYQRTGFAQTSAGDTHAEMIWRPAAHVSRRGVMAGSAVLVAAGALAPTPAEAARPISLRSRMLGRSDFKAQVGTIFKAGNGRRLKLVSVKNLSHEPSGLGKHALPLYREGSFMLTFKRVAGPPMPSASVVLEHRKLGRNRILLTPGEKDRYLAVFNREVHR